MIWIFLSVSIVASAVTGFAVHSEGSFFSRIPGQIVQGFLCLVSLAMIIAAFWIYNWKIGILEIVVIFAGSNSGLLLYRYLRKRLEL